MHSEAVPLPPHYGAFYRNAVWQEYGNEFAHRYFLGAFAAKAAS